MHLKYYWIEEEIDWKRWWNKIKTKSAKAKGRLLQNWVAEKISTLLGIPVEKDGDIEARVMGSSGTDVILRGEALKMFPFAIECKNQESFSVHAWIKQAKSNKKPGTSWLLFCKRNRDDPIVIMGAEEFFKLYEELLTWMDKE